MPRKKRQESQAEQSARFRKDARDLIKSGELDPDAAEAALDALIRKNIREHGPGN